MTEPAVKQITFTKIVTVLAITAGISLGLCGVGLAASDGGNRSGLAGKIFTVTLEAGVIGFWGSILLLTLTAIVWAIVAVIRGIRGM